MRPSAGLCVALCLAAPLAARAATYQVGPTRTHPNLQSVAPLLGAGDLVEVDFRGLFNVAAVGAIQAGNFRWSYMLQKAGLGQRWAAEITEVTSDCDERIATNSDYQSLYA